MSEKIFYPCRASFIKIPKQQSKAESEECVCYTGSGSDDSINQKIEKANFLINKVKKTLSEIKTKSKPKSILNEITSSSDKESVPSSESEDTKTVQLISDREDVVYEPINFDFDLSRPKTRRCESDEPGEVAEKFRTKPKDEKLQIENNLDFEILQAKLNTIIEQSESDILSTTSIPIEKCNCPKKASTSSVACNTEEIPKTVKSTQAVQETKSATTQSFLVTTENESQTEKPPEFAQETPETSKKPEKRLEKTHQLIVQLLPTISIPGNLMNQQILSFSIDPVGQTDIIYGGDAKNVAFIQVKSMRESTVCLSALMDDANVNTKWSTTPTVVEIKKALGPTEQTRSSNGIQDLSFGLTDRLIPDNAIELRDDLSRINWLQSHAADIESYSNYQRSEENVNKNKSKTRDLSRNVVSVSKYDLPKDVYPETKPSKTHDFEKDQVAATISRKSHMKVHSDSAVYSIQKEKQCSDLSSKEKVLQSFHIYENKNDHDPGELNPPSLDFVSSIESSIYKTYINPLGLQQLYGKRLSVIRDPKKGHVSEKFQADALLLKRSSEVAESSVQTVPESEETPAVIVAKDKETGRESVLDSTFYDIGLYSTRSTQCDLFKEQNDVAVDKDDENYEKISFSLSYSTEESVSPESVSNVVGVDKVHITTPSKINGEKTMEQVLQTIEPRKSEERSSKSKKPLKRSTEDISKFKSLKEKIVKEHPVVVNESFHFDLDSKDSKNDSSMPNFISGLMSYPPKAIHRMIPQIRRSMKQMQPLYASSSVKMQNINSSDEKKLEEHVETHVKENDDEGNKKNEYTVMPLQIHGDSLPLRYLRKNELEYVNPLQIAENGRYKDEEALFCESNYPRYEDVFLKRRRLKYLPNYYQGKHYNLESSNSDTVTTSKSVSEGEVKCQCCVSNGELHYCKDRKHSEDIFKQPQKGALKIRKQRTYFNNWITYYVNKKAVCINDSTSSSSNK